MANTKISALTAASAALSTDRIPIAISPFGSGDNRYLTPAQIATFTRATLLFVTPEMYGAVGDGSTNDATALGNAIASGLPVMLGEKNYRIDTGITITSPVRIFGSGQESIISTTNNITLFLLNTTKCHFSDFTILGDTGTSAQIGIRIEGNSGLSLDYSSHRLTNISFQNLGTCLEVYRVIGSSSSTHQGAVYAVNCLFINSTIQINLKERAEYNHFVNCTCYNGGTGILWAGGNNTFTGGSIVDCDTGINFITGTNDGHGIVSGTKINHNTTNIAGTGLVNGMLLIGCMIYSGSITLGTCSGIKFRDCEFGSIGTITLTTCPLTEFINSSWQTTLPSWSITTNAPYIQGFRVITPKTSDYTVLFVDANKMFTNTGAGGAVNLTLPVLQGLEFTFYIDAAQTLTITAPASTTIRVAGSVTSAAGNISANTVGNCITLKCISSTQWVAVSQEGTWTVSA